MARKKLNRPRKSALRPDGEPDSIRTLAVRYIEARRVRNFTEASVSGWEKSLSYFAAWCEERSVLRAVEVTKPMLERYQRWLFQRRKADGRPLGAATQYYRLQAVKGFFKWLTKENLLPSNPASELELPRLSKRLPKAVLSPVEADAVLAVPDTGDVLGLRDRAVLETLYSTGVRRKELVCLSVFDLDFERGTVLVRLGKGQKDRLLPIGERALKWVEKYLTESRPKLVVEPDNGVLFLTAAGEAFHPDTLSLEVRRYVERAEVGKSGACHLFRHTMATCMLEGGADIRFIQAMLGHSSLSATEIYTRVGIRKLKEVHAATHPSGKLAASPKADDSAPATPRDELLFSSAAEADDENEEPE